MSRNWRLGTALLAQGVAMTSCGGDSDSPSIAAANLSAAAQAQGNENCNGGNDYNNGNGAPKKNADIRVVQYVNPLIGTDYAADQPADPVGLGLAGGTLNFVMGATPNDAWVSQWNGQDPNSALAPSLALAGK